MKVEQSTNNSPSYRAIWQSQHKFSQTQKGMIQNITNNLNTVHNGLFENQTPVKWLEKQGHDIFITAGKKADSVRMFLAQKSQPKRTPFNIRLQHYIGEYNKNNNFKPEDAQHANSSYEKAERKRIDQTTLGTKIALATFGALFVGQFIGFNALMKSRMQKPTQKIEQVSKVVSDTVKTISKNTVAPWSKK